MTRLRLSARAEIIKPDARASHDGATFDAYCRSDRAMFCFSAQKNVKIASGRLLHTPTFEIVIPGSASIANESAIR
jgi:hypothetical protein